MFSTVLSAAIQGLNVDLVHVEADISNGLPIFQMVGYLSAEVKEASERVRTAIRNTGIQLPSKRIVVNLSPANVRKTGTSFDLPIAAAILTASGILNSKQLDQVLLIGELGLNGRVQKVSGILPIVLEAKKRGCHTCILPKENAKEGAFVDGIRVIGVGSLKEVIQCFSSKAMVEEPHYNLDSFSPHIDCYDVDFSDIQGQEGLKRAVEIAVAGQHNILLIGPPGAGKTMVAKRIPTILPPLTLAESMEISKIYSVLGLLKEQQPIVRVRPFRSVHHTITKSALIGGGTIPRPGEISLANGGVLFLDELPEFQKQVLEVLRQPIEEHEIQITRSRGTFTFPAKAILVAAMNPCPCGNYPDLNRCTCTETEIHHYLGKVSQPLLDRIDICIEASRIEYGELTGDKTEESSSEIRERICQARERQKNRYIGEGIYTNAELTVKGLEKHCKLSAEGASLMEQVFRKMGLTARTYHKILRVAKTIADLDEKEHIQVTHLSEAISYRTLDKKYWGR